MTLTLRQFVDLLVLLLGAMAGLGTFLYWLLKRGIDHHLKKRLENTKHELEVDLERKIVVFKHQKDSFNRVLLAMYQAIGAIENKVSVPGEWTPISTRDVNKFKEAVAREALFLDDNSDHALNLFERIMWTAVNDPSIDTFSDSDEVRHSWSQMRFIADRVAQHFRNRVGIGSGHTEPLLDVELLAAGRLITDFRIKGFSLPENSPLRFRNDQNGSQIVAIVGKNRALLRAALQALKDAASKSDRKNTPFVFDRINLIDRYLSRLDEA